MVYVASLSARPSSVTLTVMAVSPVRPKLQIALVAKRVEIRIRIRMVRHARGAVRALRPWLLHSPSPESTLDSDVGLE